MKKFKRSKVFLKMKAFSITKKRLFVRSTLFIYYQPLSLSENEKVSLTDVDNCPSEINLNI